MKSKVTLEVTQSSKKLKYPQMSHFQISHKKSVCTVQVPNEKDAMTSSCQDRKEVGCATWRMHSTRPARRFMYLSHKIVKS